jgi:hypothetical protein
MKMPVWCLIIVSVFSLALAQYDPDDELRQAADNLKAAIARDSATADIPCEYVIEINPMLSLSCPNFNFSHDYSPFIGGGLRGVYGLESRSGKCGMSIVGVEWNFDQFKDKKLNKLIDMNSFYINDGRNIYGLYEGINAGLAHMQILDTNTEFGAKKENVEFSYSRELSLRLPINRDMSINCGYQLVTTEASWMFWHNFLSGCIVELTMLPGDEIARRSHDIATVIITRILNAGISLAWYSLGYNRHDWPWHDARPVCFTRCMLGMTFDLGLVGADHQRLMIDVKPE